MSNNRRTDPGSIMQRRFDDEAGVDKNAKVDLCWQPQGNIAAKVRVTPGSPIMIFNSAGSVGYIKFSANDIGATAPSGPADGIPVAAGEKYVISAGLANYVIGSAATLFLYTVSNE